MPLTINSENLFAPSHFGLLGISFDNGNFSVIESNNKSFRVQKADLSKDLQELSSDQLQKLLTVGTLFVSKAGEDYKLRFHNKALGGGPLLALTVGLTMKGIGTAMLFVPGGQAAGAAVIIAAPAAAAACAFTPTP